MIEVYVDDFMSLVIPVTKPQLQHTADAVMTGIHDVFPADDASDDDNPIFENKLKKLEGQYFNIPPPCAVDPDGGEGGVGRKSDHRRRSLVGLLVTIHFCVFE